MNSNSTLSRLLLFALGVSLFVGSATFAQTAKSASSASVAKDATQESVLDPIAPLVNGDTICVARLGVDGLDPERLGETLQTLFEQAVVLMGFSQESINVCNAEFAKTIEALKKDGKNLLEEFKSEIGISSAYFVMQTIKGEGACVVIPAEDMSKEQVKKIVDLLESGGEMKAALYKKTFILASWIPLKEIGAYYKNFESAPNRKIESFFSANSDKAFAFYASRFKIRPLCTPSKEELEAMRQEILKAAKESYEKQRSQDDGGSQDPNDFKNPFDPTKTSVLAFDPKDFDPFYNTPQCIRNVVEVFDASFVGAQGYVDVSGLSAGLTLEFTTAVNSGKFLKALEDVIDEFVPLYYNQLQRVAELDSEVDLPDWIDVSRSRLDFVKEYRLAPLWREMTRGDLKRLLPKNYDTKVVFKGSAVETMKKIGPNSVFVATLFSALAAGSQLYFEEDEEDDVIIFDDEEFQSFDDDSEDSDSQNASLVEEEEPSATQDAEPTSAP